MLTYAENELMCRVGPGTGMGAALRRYWLPALSSSKLSEAGGDPVHVQLLGENFVAFRDAEGRVGLLDEACCHRGASLLLGRVEGCGIRCIYHGWKYAVNGKVLETPHVPDGKFKDRIRARAYPVRCQAGSRPGRERRNWCGYGLASAGSTTPKASCIDSDINCASQARDIRGIYHADACRQ